ncbi:hypothetical protein NicSoilB4_27090 [Arthrobacter sp. NicSoilB4]|nr:hypothetical protein NicSoilB4_27090 [Arthrobacter sp. NicSoilB4]
MYNMDVHTNNARIASRSHLGRTSLPRQVLLAAELIRADTEVKTPRMSLGGSMVLSGLAALLCTGLTILVPGKA